MQHQLLNSLHQQRPNYYWLWMGKGRCMYLNENENVVVFNTRTREMMYNFHTNLNQILAFRFDRYKFGFIGFEHQAKQQKPIIKIRLFPWRPKQTSKRRIYTTNVESTTNTATSEFTKVSIKPAQSFSINAELATRSDNWGFNESLIVVFSQKHLIVWY